MSKNKTRRAKKRQKEKAQRKDMLKKIKKTVTYDEAMKIVEA